MHAIIHAKSAARAFGGDWQKYLPIEEWLDETKYWTGNALHRVFRHHSEGIKWAEEVFGRTILNSEGKEVFVKYICERHIREDCNNYIPSAKEWLMHIQTGKPAIWMLKTMKIETKGNIYEQETETGQGEVRKA